MKTRTLTAVTVLALLSSVPAFADAEKKNGDQAAVGSGDIQKDAEQAVEEIKEDASEAYEDIKAYILGSKAGEQSTEVTIDSRHTVKGMIGHSVQNAKGDRVGTVKDIILDAGGNAMMVVIADRDVPGFEGKLVALDYNLVSVRNLDGDVIAPLTEDTISKIAAFSYDPKDREDGAYVMPDEGISISKLLEGQLVDNQMQPLAEIENISLKNGHTTDLIVGFGKVVGLLGGQAVVLSYDDAKLVRVEDGYDFQLSADKAAHFEAYKKSVTN